MTSLAILAGVSCVVFATVIVLSVCVLSSRISRHTPD